MEVIVKRLWKLRLRVLATPIFLISMNNLEKLTVELGRRRKEFQRIKDKMKSLSEQIETELIRQFINQRYALNSIKGTVKSIISIESINIESSNSNIPTHVVNYLNGVLTLVNNTLNDKI